MTSERRSPASPEPVHRQTGTGRPVEPKPLVVGIHGFAPKPAAPVLRDYWHSSLCEGLRRNAGLELTELDFEMVYWADLLHDSPKDPDPEPYHPAPGFGPLPTYCEDWLDEMIVDIVGRCESMLDQAMKLMGFHQRTAELLKRICDDIERYIQEPELPRAIRQRLHEKLLAHRGRPIVLIAHSVGSVIAYEVLRELEALDELDAGSGDPNEPWIRAFYTMGSPLGFPYITHQLCQTCGPNRVPTNVGAWVNLADRRDPATLDVHLHDDFPCNPNGTGIQDDLVINAYLDPAGARNTHKVFGYLRTPELSRHLAAVLDPAAVDPIRP